MKKDDEISVQESKKLFTLDHLLIDGKANVELLSHLSDVAINTMGGFIADNFPEVRSGQNCTV